MRVHQHSAITAILQHSDNEHAAEEQNNDKNFRSMKKPIWKTVHHEQLDFTHQRNDKDKKTTETKLSKSDYLLPDVGILVHRASPRILQTNNVQEGYAADDNYLTGGIHSDYCKYFQSRNSTCDCNNWSTDGLGSFECLRYGQEYCVNNVCRTVTMNMEGSFLEPSSMSYMMELCTITTSSQEQHTYCASILTLNELASDGSILGSSYTCNLSVDGSDCKKCSIDTYCVLATNPWDIVPSLVGEFDCTNTAADTKGSFCHGDKPFPYLSNKTSAFADSNSSSSSNTSTAVIVGSVVGGMCGVLLLGTVAALWVARRTKDLDQTKQNVPIHKVSVDSVKEEVSADLSRPPDG